jgi:hypothetical protein
VANNSTSTTEKVLLMTLPSFDLTASASLWLCGARLISGKWLVPESELADGTKAANHK